MQTPFSFGQYSIISFDITAKGKVNKHPIYAEKAAIVILHGKYGHSPNFIINI